MGEKVPKNKKLGICVVINDAEKELLREIVAQNGSLEDGALFQVDGDKESSAYRIPLDTKYYSCEFILWNLPTFEIANKWFSERNSPSIFSLFVKADLVKFSKYSNEFFTKTRETVKRFKANTQAIVLKFPKIQPELDDCAELIAKRNSLQKFSEDNGELIELNTPKEWTDEEDLEGCLFGIDRVVELLGIGFAECGKVGFDQKIKTNPMDRYEHKIKLQEYLESVTNVTRQFDNEEPKAKQNDYPDSEDEAAIMAMFDRSYPQLPMPSIPLPLISEQTSDSRSRDTRQSTQYSEVELQPKNNADGGNSSKKNKRKKNQRSKQQKCEVEGEKLASDDLSEGRKLLNVNAVLDKVLKGTNLKSNFIDPTKFRSGNSGLRLTELLGSLNESREICRRLPDEERINMSERVCAAFLKSLTTGEEIEMNETSDNCNTQCMVTTMAQTLNTI